MTYEELICEWRDFRMAEGACMPRTIQHDVTRARHVPLPPKDVARLTPLDVATALASMRREIENGTYLRECFKAGKKCLKWGVMMGLLERNPFDKVQAPRQPRTDRRSLTLGEARRLHEELEEDGSAFALAALTALETGMRHGEVVALRREDVRDGAIHVERAFKCAPLSDGRPVIGEPKSWAGRRVISIGPELERRLLAAGDPWVFGGEEPPSYYRLGHWWDRWREEHGFHGLRFHELRHTNATLMVASGVDIKTAQERLGHSDPSITLAVYAHATREGNEDAARRIGEAIA